MRQPLLSALLLLPGALAAQAKPAPFPAANATLPFEFSEVNSLVELSDGRVLITDRIENMVFLGDFTTKRVTPAGSRGDGPGEFQRALPLVLVGRDSALMPNGLSRRWLLFDATGKATTLPSTHPLATTSERRFFSRDGRVLIITPPPMRVRSSPPDSSGLALLRDRRTGRTDTLGGMLMRQTELIPKEDIEAYALETPHVPRFSREDDVVLAPDGWVAFVRQMPYRVEWRAPDGRWVRGAPSDETPVPVTEREKKAFADRQEAQRTVSAVVRGPGVGTYTGPPRPAVVWDWPLTLPPFASFPPAVWPTNNAQVVVQRVPSADRPERRLDVFDRRGVRVRQLMLTDRQRILAFGATSAYILTTDDDGIQRISRHPWP